LDSKRILNSMATLNSKPLVNVKFSTFNIQFNLSLERKNPGLDTSLDLNRTLTKPKR
jgi:hypothetical protein